MKKFLIKVNGNQYEVEVEEIKEDGTFVEPAAPVVKAPVVESVVKKAEVPKKPVSVKADTSVPEGAEPVKAPIPGTVLKIMVNKGDTVKRGDVLLILEAMKMENEIIAHRDGSVTSINVETGSSVNSGDVLVTIA